MQDFMICLMKTPYFTCACFKKKKINQDAVYSIENLRKGLEKEFIIKVNRKH